VHGAYGSKRPYSLAGSQQRAPGATYACRTPDTWPTGGLRERRDGPGRRDRREAAAAGVRQPLAGECRRCVSAACTVRTRHALYEPRRTRRAAHMVPVTPGMQRTRAVQCTSDIKRAHGIATRAWLATGNIVTYTSCQGALGPGPHTHTSARGRSFDRSLLALLAWLQGLPNRFRITRRNPFRDALRPALRTWAVLLVPAQSQLGSRAQSASAGRRSASAGPTPLGTDATPSRASTARPDAPGASRAARAAAVAIYRAGGA
jgi:hypothetical protein